MIFYFSGTGNSRYVAQKVAETNREPLIYIADELKKGNLPEYHLSNNEILGFVFPIYSWGIPSIMRDFIKNATFHNYQNQYIFFICTCGDDTGLTPKQVRKLFSDKKIICNAGFSVIMPNNYIIFPGFDTDSPETENKKLKEAPFRIDYINRTIQKRKNIYDCHEGRFRYIKSNIINPLFNKYQVRDKAFYVTDDCIECGLCERRCPVNNITLEPNPIWHGNCLQCLACLHYCPTHAIQYGKLTLKKGRYHFHDIH